MIEEKTVEGVYHFVFDVFPHPGIDLCEPLRGEATGAEFLGIQPFDLMLELW